MRNVADWPSYHYRGTLLRAVDGDTVRVRLDLGLRTSREVSLRIAGIDAPELHRGGPDARGRGAAAKEFVGRYEGESVYVTTHKDRKSFDRYVADIYLDQEGELQDLAEIIVANRYAKRV